MTREQIIKLAREVCAIAQQEKNGEVEYLFSVEKLERFAALVAAAKCEDGAILDSMDARPHDCRGLDKTPQGWRVIPKGKLTPVLYKDLRSAMKSGLGIEGQS